MSYLEVRGLQSVSELPKAIVPEKKLNIVVEMIVVEITYHSD